VDGAHRIPPDRGSGPAGFELAPSRGGASFRPQEPDMLRKTLRFSVAAFLLISLLGAVDAAKLGERCNVDTRCSQGLWCDPTPGQCGSAERGRFADATAEPAR